MTQGNPSNNAKQIFDIAMRECDGQLYQLERIRMDATESGDKDVEIKANTAIAEIKIRAVSASLVVAAEWAQFEALTKSRLEVRIPEEDGDSTPETDNGCPFDEALPAVAP